MSIQTMNQAKLEILKFVKDQNDRYLTNRESLISRYGNIRLLAGLLLTVFSFSIGVVVKSLENAHGILSKVVASLPLIFFAVAIYFIIKALLAIPDLVGNIDIHVPIVDEDAIDTMRLNLNEDESTEVLAELAGSYLDALQKNAAENHSAGKQLEKCVGLIRRGVLATIVYLAMTFFSGILIPWLVLKP